MKSKEDIEREIATATKIRTWQLDQIDKYIEALKWVLDEDA